MKKFILLLMGLALAVSAYSQAVVPKPAMPSLTEFIDYGAPVGINLGYEIAADFDGNLVGDDYTIDKYFNNEEYTILDSEKVSFTIFTDNGQIFTFTPEMFPGQVNEPLTQFPYSGRTPSGDIGYWDIHFNGLTNEGEEPFFTWRIGIQTHYTDGDVTTSSDIYYMEIYPQLQEAKNVTSTSFLADWSCDAENTFMINNFIGEGCGYFLYVVDKATQEVVLTQNVEPTNTTTGVWGNTEPLPGATYNVEGLTPGKTYEYYVVVKQNTGKSYQSVVREVTLPAAPVYLLGQVNDQNWAPNVGTPMTYDAENKVYTATVNLDANETFGFTTELAMYDDQGSWDYIEPFRFGPESNGDFELLDQYLGQELTLTFDNYGAIKVLSTDEYKVTVSLEENYIIVEKVTPEPQGLRGDVNDDKKVDISDATLLINYLLYGDETGVNKVNANCDLVGGIDISDATALINFLLYGTW